MEKASQSLLAKLLDYLRQGYTLKEAALELSVKEDNVRLLYYTLASQGIISVIKPKASKCSCEGCPFRKYCSLDLRRLAKKKGKN